MDPQPDIAADVCVRQPVLPPQESDRGFIGTFGKEMQLDGTLTLSRDGRFAITTPIAARENDFHVVTDFASGESTFVPGGFESDPQAVTNSGATSTKHPYAVTLTDRSGVGKVLLIQKRVADAIVDPAGKSVV